MSRRLLAHPPGRLRRLGAGLALLGLVFASTIASIAHSTAMPMMAAAALPDTGQAQSGHHMGNMAHDCQGDAGDVAPQRMPQGPCDEGCLLCKNCTITSYLPMSPIGIDGVEGYGNYQPAQVYVLAGVTPPSPNEPPRV